MCHAPKLESGYHDKRIFFLVTYCAWFQGFSNTSLTFPSIPTTFSTGNLGKGGSVPTKLVYLLILSLIISVSSQLLFPWTEITLLSLPESQLKVQLCQTRRSNQDTLWHMEGCGYIKLANLYILASPSRWLPAGSWSSLSYSASIHLWFASSIRKSNT